MNGYNRAALFWSLCSFFLVDNGISWWSRG